MMIFGTKMYLIINKIILLLIMCYNKTTSLSAFIFGMIFTFLLISKKKYKHALFNSAIVLMQLIEYFGHLSLETKNSFMNTIVSGFILTIIFLQPIIYIYAFYPQSKLYKNNTFQYSILLFTIIYIFFLYNLISSNQLKISYFKPDCTNYCRMNWRFFGEKLYLSIPFIFMYFYLFNAYTLDNSRNNFNRLFFYTLSLSILYMIFVDHLKGLKNYYSGFGSIWCILSFIYGPIVYFFT